MPNEHDDPRIYHPGLRHYHHQTVRPERIRWHPRIEDHRVFARSWLFRGAESVVVLLVGWAVVSSIR